MAGTINPDASRIWDEAEVYILDPAKVTGAEGIEGMVPAAAGDELSAEWEFVGLLDAGNGIPVEPDVEIVHYDGFGHPRYRSKARKGSVTTGFTALEDNTVTRKFVLPGSKPGRIGAPKNIRFYVAYVLRDEDIVTDVWVSTRPALFELGSFTKAEGEQEMYEVTVHNANDAKGDVFIRVDDAEDTPDSP